MDLIDHSEPVQNLRVCGWRRQFFRQMTPKPQAILCVLTSETFVSLGFWQNMAEKMPAVKGSVPDVRGEILNRL